MAHMLDSTKSGSIRMAYANREIPWHRLGTPMKGLQTCEAMLDAAHANFDVVTTKVAAVDVDGNFIRNPDGSPVIIDDSRATVRVNLDGSFDGLATVGTRYVVQQNKACLESAISVVGASKGDAIVDTCGILHGGREFFASLDLGGLVIDPKGVNDKIERYLLVRNGHDGRTPITFANTSIRAVCKNTVIAGMKEARRVFTARHTRNAETAIEEAQEVLNISTEWAKSFVQAAETMLSIEMPSAGRNFDKYISTLFPQKTGETERQEKNRFKILSTVRALYENERNAGGYGYNGWSAYNAVVEYLDHYRDVDKDDHAIASMSSTSLVTQKKVQAQNLILSFT